MMWLTVLVAAIAVAMMLAIQEVPILPSATKTMSMDNSHSEYNIIELDAPAMSGVLLTIITWIVTRTPLRPFILRFLLNQNDVHLIRDLAATKLAGVPATYYPLARLSAIDYDYHVQAARMSNPESIVSSRGLHTTCAEKAKYRSAMDYHQIYKSGKATPTQVLTKVLQGCDTLQHLHIFSSFRPDDVLQQAAESDQRYKAGRPLSVLDGVPIGVKDMVHVRGHVLCYGSMHCSPSAATDDTAMEDVEDDIMVARFRQAGAIILGVTVSTEGGVTPLGYSLAFDGPFNPYHLDYYPGGSSSGSAVLVASGLAPIALGFDGGGSIRIPASMSGTFGLAVTFGRVETDAALGCSVIKAGSLAASTTDLALAHLVMSHKKNDSSTNHLYSDMYDGGIHGVPPAHINGLEDSVKGMRLGIYWDHFLHSDPEVVQACTDTVAFLTEQGAEVVNITIPHLREIHLAHGLKILSELAAAWDSAFYDPAVWLEANTDITIALGKQLTAAEVLAGEQVRTWAIDGMRNKIFRDQNVDAIVSPTLGLKVPKPYSGFRSTGESNTPLVYKVMRFIPLANFLGLPALSVPVGYERDTGLPIGCQLLGDAWMEHKLLRIASTIESKYLQRRTPETNYFDPLSEWSH